MILFKNIDYLNEDFEWIKNVNIIIKDNKIDQIIDDVEKIDLSKCDSIIEGKNKLVIPGMFNMHSHVPMTLLRGYGEGLNLQDWLYTRIFPFEDTLTAEEVYYGALLGISEFLSSGTVSFSDMYMRLQGLIQAVDESGIKANLTNAAVGMKPDLRYTDDPSYQEEKYLLDFIKSNPETTVRADAGIHAEYTSTPQLVEQVIQFAKENNLMLQIHISETEKEHLECQERQNGMTPVEYFDSLGAFEQKCILAHCIYTTDNDLDILKDKGAVLVHNPASNFKLGSGFANIRKWLDNGNHVCLGTDGAASNNDLDIFQEMRLAALLSNGLHRDANSITPVEMLKITSINGALAQNRLTSGYIKEGFDADLLVIDLDTPNMQPIYDLPTNLVYSLNQKNIYLTMVNGKILYQENEFKTIDIEKVKTEVKRIQKDKLHFFA
ncbi:MAG: amidohydrolase [Clostridiaceae bacterium]|nr:amidohydrolase [Clostridiaceae bacterium]